LELAAGSRQAPHGLASHPSPAHELLAREGLLEPPQRLAQFSLADGVENVVEIAHHMKLVVDDLGDPDDAINLGTAVGPDTVLEGTAHVDDGVGDLSGSRGTEPPPKSFSRCSEQPSTT